MLGVYTDVLVSPVMGHILLSYCRFFKVVTAHIFSNYNDFVCSYALCSRLHGYNIFSTCLTASVRLLRFLFSCCVCVFYSSYWKYMVQLQSYFFYCVEMLFCLLFLFFLIIPLCAHFIGLQPMFALVTAYRTSSL